MSHGFYELKSKVSYFSVGKLAPMTYLDGGEALNPVQEDIDVTVSSHLSEGGAPSTGTHEYHRVARVLLISISARPYP